MSEASPAEQATGDTAVLYRMVTSDHTCPYGIKSRYLLQNQGFSVIDRHLVNREETEAFRDRHGVDTTPQVWIDGQRIGGYDALRRFFGKKVIEQGATSYRPVVAIFVVAALMALATSWLAYKTPFTLTAFELFIAISMCFLAVQKLQDVESFSTMFLNYDLLARRWVPYGYVYPYGEALAGILMMSGALVWIASPVALFIGSVGAVSVFKAVYIDKREIKCACVGGSSNVPLGFVSLTENVMMVGMGTWMLVKQVI